MFTVAPPSVVGSGTTGALCVLPASSVPNTAMIVPGEKACLYEAALVTPAIHICVVHWTVRSRVADAAV